MVNNDDEVSNDMISMIRESRVEQLVVSRSARVSSSISVFTARFSWRVTTTSYITLDLSVCIYSRCATCSRVLDTLSAKYRSPRTRKIVICAINRSSAAIHANAALRLLRNCFSSCELLVVCIYFYFLTYFMYRENIVFFKTFNFQRKF